MLIDRKSEEGGPALVSTHGQERIAERRAQHDCQQHGTYRKHGKRRIVKDGARSDVDLHETQVDGLAQKRQAVIAPGHCITAESDEADHLTTRYRRQGNVDATPPARQSLGYGKSV